MSRIVIFAVDADATRYLAWCNARNPDLTPGAQWYSATARDKSGKRVVGYLGPDGSWAGVTEEPAGGIAARAGGTLTSAVVWPGE